MFVLFSVKLPDTVTLGGAYNRGRPSVGLQDHAVCCSG